LEQSTTKVDGTKVGLAPVVQLIAVVVTVEMTQGISSIVTVQAPAVKLVPVMVKDVPPAVVPFKGVIVYTFGVESYLYSTTSVSVISLSFEIIFMSHLLVVKSAANPV
jgi:hypothetical protein